MSGRGKRSIAGKAPSRERGLALLVVLWIVVAAALIVIAFNAAVKSGVAFAGSEVQMARADALLDAGAEIAAARLVDEEESRQWVPDGEPHTVSFAGANLAIAIADANGRIDLNKTDKKIITGLLRQFTGSDAKASRLSERISLARGDAPEKSEQMQQDQSANAGHAEKPAAQSPAFIDVAQLRGLQGMTMDLYRAIAPYLTVYSNDGSINPQAAPDAVLLSIPELTEADIKKLRTFLRSPEESQSALGDIGQRAGSYLTDKPGPAYIVTVELLKRDGTPGASSVYVMAPGIDKEAPYRLIAKRPVEPRRLGGAS